MGERRKIRFLEVLLLLAVVDIHRVYGFVTCFCNLPQCELNGNTCTALDRCYSKFYTRSSSNNDTVENDEFGCVDMLPLQESDADGPVCDGDEGTAVKRTSTGYPLLYCCSGNMCNSKDERDISVDIAASSDPADGQLNGEDILVVEEVRSPLRPRSSTTSEDAIFRAAVVAVPIAGSLILIVLIVMAVKMLKDDQRNTPANHGGFLKTNRFIQKHFPLSKKPHKSCIKPPTTSARVKSGRSESNQYDEESLQPLQAESNLINQSNIARHPRLCHSLSVV